MQNIYIKIDPYLSLYLVLKMVLRCIIIIKCLSIGRSNTGLTKFTCKPEHGIQCCSVPSVACFDVLLTDL